jgi:hypothetical protein
MSNPASGEQNKTVVDACYQAGVERRLREFAQYPHPDFTTTAPKLPKVFVSSSESRCILVASEATPLSRTVAFGTTEAADKMALVEKAASKSNLYQVQFAFE